MDVVKDLSLGNPPDELNVFIEIPRGSKNKYEVDKDSGLVTLDRVFPTAFAYPLDYGLLPQTHWHDGDPLDALVYNSVEPYFPGVVVPARPIGLIEMTDNGEKDEKIITLPIDDKRLGQVKDLKDLPPNLHKELQHFYEHVKDLEGKKIIIHGFKGRAEAENVIKEAAELYKSKK